VRARIKLALELGKPAKHGEHQATVRRRGVRPCVAKRSESGSGLRYRIETVQEVARRAREAVKARHKQGIPFIKGFDCSRRLAPVGLGSARGLTKNLLRSGVAQLLHLSVNALAVRAYPRITENRHAGIVARRSLFASIFCIAQPSGKAGALRLCESPADRAKTRPDGIHKQPAPY